MKNSKKIYKDLLILAKLANGRKETLSFLNEAAKINSRLNYK